MKIDRILKDYRDAGSLNRLVGVWGFVDDTTFLTKSGHVGVTYRLAGVDVERLTHTQRATFVHQFAAALRLLDERFRVYQHLIKRIIPPLVPGHCDNPVAREAIEQRAAFLNERRRGLYELSLYLTVVYEPRTSFSTSTPLRNIWRSPSMALRNWLSTRRTLELVDSELSRAIETLHHQARAVEVQLGDFGPTRLQKAELFRFLRLLLNYEPAVVDASALSHDVHVDYFAADSPVDCDRDNLTVGHRAVKVLSMKEPPNHTFAHVLAELYAVPGEFIACLEWQRLANERTRRDIQSRRRHFFNKRVSLVNYVSPDVRSEDMLVDDSATATVQQCGEALTELEVNGHFFGLCSLTLVLHSPDATPLKRQVAEALKALAAHDGSFFEESYNLLNAWLSTIPGNGAYNVRRLALLETNYADLAFLFTIDSGQRQSVHPDHEALAVFETPHQVPYAFDLHVGDVGHTLILGATGSGKSFLVNFLVTHAQKYEPVTVILDPATATASWRRCCAVVPGAGPGPIRRHDQPVCAHAHGGESAFSARVRARAARGHRQPASQPPRRPRGTRRLRTSMCLTPPNIVSHRGESAAESVSGPPA